MKTGNKMLWIQREAGDNANPVQRYTEKNNRWISIRTVHGGQFDRSGALRYTGDLVHTFDHIDPADLSFSLLEEMFKSVGFTGRPYFFYQHPEEDFEYGMIRLETQADFARFQCTVWPNRWRLTPTIFAEANKPNIDVYFPRSLLHATRAKMVELLWPCVSDNPHLESEGAQAYLIMKYGIVFPLPMIKAVRDETTVAIWAERKRACYLGS